MHLQRRYIMLPETHRMISREFFPQALSYTGLEHCAQRETRNNYDPKLVVGEEHQQPQRARSNAAFHQNKYALTDIYS